MRDPQACILVSTSWHTSATGVAFPRHLLWDGDLCKPSTCFLQHQAGCLASGLLKQALDDTERHSTRMSRYAEEKEDGKEGIAPVRECVFVAVRVCWDVRVVAPPPHSRCTT